ncbi:hypothetical protein RBSWK_02555 [Rhodopirellula baltica SWK14]|uniref:Uncharacterized protein n=1 Tax=Rhodopirellula baltica SWK14 TaxID=993516 RepID=L7CHP9_RHOBT|nr:hypothetical protein RBSWK_02555 [Rhodopirellula baltica SWK14]
MVDQQTLVEQVQLAAHRFVPVDVKRFRGWSWTIQQELHSQISGMSGSATPRDQAGNRKSERFHG